MFFYHQCHFYLALYIFLSLQIFPLLFFLIFSLFSISDCFLSICFRSTFTFLKSNQGLQEVAHFQRAIFMRLVWDFTPLLQVVQVLGYILSCGSLFPSRFTFKDTLSCNFSHHNSLFHDMIDLKKRESNTLFLIKAYNKLIFCNKCKYKIYKKVKITMTKKHNITK